MYSARRKAYSWDPLASDRDEEADDLGGLRGLYAQGEDLFLTISDFGVTEAWRSRWPYCRSVVYPGRRWNPFRDPVDLFAAPMVGGS